MERSEMLDSARERIGRQIERTESGEVVCEKTSSEGEKVIVTKTMARDENGNDYFFSSAPTLRTVEIKNHS